MRSYKYQTKNYKENVSPDIEQQDTVNDDNLKSPKCGLSPMHPSTPLLTPYSVLQPSPLSSLSCTGYDITSSPNIFQFPPPIVQTSSLSTLQELRLENLTCTVEKEGFLRLQLRAGVVMDIAPTLAVRMRNTVQYSSIAMSSCATQIALVHPKGRVLCYGPTIEMQTKDTVSVKNAKIHPPGVSFTASNCSLAYLLDEDGTGSTSCMFHDLHASHIVDTLFETSSKIGGGKNWAVMAGVQMLKEIQYWRDEEDYWIIGGINVRQTRDGLVTVERQQEGDNILIKTSPNNGKVRFDSRMVQVTASLGQGSHMFLRSGDRRLHYCGQSAVFTVRNAGHSAGFDEEGVLRIL